MPVSIIELDGIKMAEVDDVVMEVEEAVDLIIRVALTRCLLQLRDADGAELYP